jgi:hypothetical protein
MWTPCVNAEGRVKKRYPSEEAAHRDLAHSPKWRRRSTWPAIYRCPACRAWHLAHGERT